MENIKEEKAREYKPMSKRTKWIPDKAFRPYYWYGVKAFLIIFALGMLISWIFNEILMWYYGR